MNGFLPPALQALKVATRAALHAAGGGSAAAQHVSVGQQKLSDYCNPNLSDRFARADVIAQIEALTHGTPGHPHITRALALHAGYGLVPLAHAHDDAKGWPEHIAALAKESGEIVASLVIAAADGKVTATEIRKSHLVREADEAIAALVGLRAALIGVLSDD